MHENDNPPTPCNQANAESNPITVAQIESSVQGTTETQAAQASNVTETHPKSIYKPKKLSFTDDPAENSPAEEHISNDDPDRVLPAENPLKRSMKIDYDNYKAKRKQLNIRFPKQGCVTSLLVMASNSKFLDPDLLSLKDNGVAILRVSMASEAPKAIELFKELFPRISLKRIVICLGTNDADHVLDDYVVVKRLGHLKCFIQECYNEAESVIMCLLPSVTQ